MSKKRKAALEAIKVTKVYNEDEPSEVTVLKGINLSIYEGEFIVIMGPSGSGKTTLLDVIGCLLKPTAGEIKIEGQAISELNDRKRALLRRDHIGFVFQQYNLLPSGSAKDNVLLPMRIRGTNRHDANKRAEYLLRLVGLENRMSHKPSELSGGEQQRVAIARSLANDPNIILGDEPTGNLDTKTGTLILTLLKKLNKEKGYTIVIITHDPSVTKYADRVIRIRDGQVESSK